VLHQYIFIYILFYIFKIYSCQYIAHTGIFTLSNENSNIFRFYLLNNIFNLFCVGLVLHTLVLFGNLLLEL